MTEIRESFKTVEREAYWMLPRLAAFITVVALAIWGVTILLAPTKVFSPENVRTNYEFFHDTKREHDARVRQIAAHRLMLMAESVSSPGSVLDPRKSEDRAETRRIRIEVAGMQHACRELAAKYNSRSNQLHRGVFKGTTLPAELDETKCE